MLKRALIALVCWMIRFQLAGHQIVVQREGVDFDAGPLTGVYPIASPEGTRFVCVIACTHGVTGALGVQIIQRSFEYPSVKWDHGRRQFVVRNYEP
jgi:hypothetical protein